MTWTPKGWWTPTAIVPEALRVGHVCHCLNCTIDGQHNPLCNIHQEPSTACDCARGELIKIPPPPLGAS